MRVCSVEGCEGKVNSRGFCKNHLYRWQTYGDPVGGMRFRGRLCQVDGCGKPHDSHGYCVAHAHRFLRYGSPTSGQPSRGGPKEFYLSVVLSYDGDDCLIWPFLRDGKGYARGSVYGKQGTVSRIACRDANGPPPTPSHQAAHSCGNGHLGCVNQKHLSWKTNAENILDKIAHGNSGLKINSSAAIEIFKLRGVLPSRRVAKKFGVGKNTILRVWRGET